MPARVAWQKIERIYKAQCNPWSGTSVAFHPDLKDGSRSSHHRCTELASISSLRASLLKMLRRVSTTHNAVSSFSFDISFCTENYAPFHVPSPKMRGL